MSNDYAYSLSKQARSYWREKGKCEMFVQDYLINQARTRLDRLLTDTLQYYKVESENSFSA